MASKLASVFATCGRRVTLVCIIAALTSRNCIGPIDCDLDGSPFSVTGLIRGPISQTIDGPQVSHYLLVSTGEILQALHFVENSTANISHLFHPIIGHIEGFGLCILWIHCLIVRVQTERIQNSVKFLHSAKCFSIRELRAVLTADTRNRSVQAIAHKNDRCASRLLSLLTDLIHCKSSSVVETCVAS